MRMKKMNIIKTALIASILSVSSVSCSDWLDVEMSDNILESNLFSTTEGFLTALNGVYVNMNNVYGSTLSAGVIDVMAQLYNVTENDNHSYKAYSGYKFNESSFENMSGNLWQTQYSNIAHLNVILEHCDESNSALAAHSYSIVKGEALALRAMMHFDLLRLYGPIYSDATASVEAIPYQTSSERLVLPILSASKVIEMIINDLNEASTLLKEVDPVITEGVKNEIAIDDGVTSYADSYRQLRLNYYAVQALLARVYLWKGDKQNAYRIAKEEILDKVYTDALTVFPWASQNTVDDTKKPDRLFSSEVMFSLYSYTRSNLYNNLFSEALSTSSRLTFVGSGIANDDSKIQTFYDEPLADWRAKMWSVAYEDGEPAEGEEGGAGEEGSLYFLKYAEPAEDAEFNGSETYRYMIPLIRMSEVFLIAAECATNQDEAFEYLNAIREHRGCRSLNATDGELLTLIRQEFAREMIGEGQLFFFYKRLGLEVIPSGSSASGTYNMVLSNYVWPLPKIETDKRGSNNF